MVVVVVLALKRKRGEWGFSKELLVSHKEGFEKGGFSKGLRGGGFSKGLREGGLLQGGFGKGASRFSRRGASRRGASQGGLQGGSRRGASKPPFARNENEAPFRSPLLEAPSKPP